MQIEVLKDILSFDENNENAIKVLAAIYEKRKMEHHLQNLLSRIKIRMAISICLIIL